MMISSILISLINDWDPSACICRNDQIEIKPYVRIGDQFQLLIWRFEILRFWMEKGGDEYMYCWMSHIECEKW